MVAAMVLTQLGVVKQDFLHGTLCLIKSLQQPLTLYGSFI